MAVGSPLASTCSLALPASDTMADEENRPAATHNSPRTWLLTAALSPLAVRLIRQLLSHGDYVVACLPPQEIDHEQRSAEFRELIAECKSSRKDREGWKDRIRGIRCDGNMSSCISAVTDAVAVFGRIDVLLCCRSEGVQCVQSKFLMPKIAYSNQPSLHSCRGHGRGAFHQSTHAKPSQTTVRKQLFLTGELHQGHAATAEETTYRAHYCTHEHLRPPRDARLVHVFSCNMGLRGIL